MYLIEQHLEDGRREEGRADNARQQHGRRVGPLRELVVLFELVCVRAQGEEMEWTHTQSEQYESM